MTKIVKIKPMKRLAFSDILDISENLQNMLIFHGDKYINETLSFDEIKCRLAMLSNIILENSSIITTFKISGTRYLCIFDASAGIFDYREIKNDEITNTSFFSYRGLGIILFSSEELKNVFVQKKDFLKAREKMSQENVIIKLVVVFVDKEKEIDMRYYKGMLGTMFNSPFVMFVKDKQVVCDSMPYIGSIKNDSI